MLRSLQASGLIVLLLPLASCQRSDDLPTQVEPSANAWSWAPEELPEGLQGRNTCEPSTLLGIREQWNFHPEGGCWQREAPDGFVRQQLYHVHLFSIGACAGGAGDLDVVRACVLPPLPGQVTPCGFSATNGCTACPPTGTVTCH